MLSFEVHTGGLFQTNAYAVPTPSGGRLIVDAPAGVTEWAEAQGWKVEGLLLTHTHLDHVEEAARVEATFGCPVWYHPEGEMFLRDKDAFRRWGIDQQLEQVQHGVHITGSSRAEFAGVAFRVLEVPGHCPGSLAFYRAEEKWVISGDTLFALGVGRTDLPFASEAVLYRSIREQLFPLGDDVRVLPGHGPETTIGRERLMNPFLT